MVIKSKVKAHHHIIIRINVSPEGAIAHRKMEDNHIYTVLFCLTLAKEVLLYKERN